MFPTVNKSLIGQDQGEVEVYKELVMDMVVEEVNRELLKEFNESLVLVCRCGDGLRGDHKVDGGGSGTGQEG